MTPDQFQINRDEHPTTPDKIELAETRWENRFPEDYKTFLLQYNGGEIYPGIPSIKATTSRELRGIERLLSVGDIILQKHYPLGYTWHHQHEQQELEKYNVKTESLVAFALADRGCYYINLEEGQYGQIYFACYQDWDGFVRLETNSFTEFLNSLRPFPHPIGEFSGFSKTRKIYDSRYFYTPDKPELGIERFKEVLSFLGDANSRARDSDWTVIQHYAYDNPYDKMNPYIFDYLLENGGHTDGLLNRTRNIERVKKLIVTYGADINKPYKNRYPIIDYTGISSWAAVKENYYLIDQLLQLDLPIDFSVLDDEGKTVTQRLKEMVVEYEKYRQYDKDFWKTKPEMHRFLTSETINKLIQ